MIDIRVATTDDLNFIYATWLKGLYHGSDFFKNVDKDAFFANYQAIVKGILDKTNVKASVACLSSDPTVILGYAVRSVAGPLHWLYVKEAWRRQGIASRLIGDCSEISSITHITDLGNKLRLSKGWKFNPWLI